MTDTPEYTGGSVSYYTCSVTHPINAQADPYDAECIDIIDALQMTPNEANAFKALWRRAAARLGKSKRGYTDGLYDAEKVEFYGRRLVELERRAASREKVARETVDVFVEEILRDPSTTLGQVQPTKIMVKCTDCGEAWDDFHICRNAVKKLAELDPPNDQALPVAQTYESGPPMPEGDGWRSADLPGPRNMNEMVEFVSLQGDRNTGFAKAFSWNNVAWWRFSADVPEVPWTEHSKHEGMPVEPETLIEIKLTGGSRNTGFAKHFFWGGCAQRITHWRIAVTPPSDQCRADCSPGCRTYNVTL